MTQLESARKGIITKQMKKAASEEGITGEELRQKIAAGEAVLPYNINHQSSRPIAVELGNGTWRWPKPAKNWIGKNKLNSL